MEGPRLSKGETQQEERKGSGRMLGTEELTFFHLVLSARDPPYESTDLPSSLVRVGFDERRRPLLQLLLGTDNSAKPSMPRSMNDYKSL